MLARPGIVDAMLVGCVPVFFDARQSRLWPNWWHAEMASVNFCWHLDVPHLASAFNATSMAARAEGLLPNASAALEALRHMPQIRVAHLQTRVAEALPRFLYASKHSLRPDGQATMDAIEHLLLLLQEGAHDQWD